MTSHLFGSVTDPNMTTTPSDYPRNPVTIDFCQINASFIVENDISYVYVLLCNKTSIDYQCSSQM